MSIAARFAAVSARLAAAADRAGRDPATVQLVTVTKGHVADRVREVVEAGATVLGENRIEEAEQKIPALADLAVAWHMIGHLQSRKAKRAGTLFTLVHSVDRTKTAAILGGDRRPDTPLDILLEVNVAGETSKHGVDSEHVRPLLDDALGLPGVRVCGLMTMAPATPDPEDARPIFAALRELRDRLADNYGDRCTLAELSMGMTNDFEVAVEEGATLVRIGTAIMGPRTNA